MSNKEVHTIPKSIKFLFGGTAGMGATLFVQPLDLVKNRMQMSGEGGGAKVYSSSFDALLKIGRSEGVRSLYNGLSAGLARQAVYTTARLGIYTSLFDMVAARKKNDKPPGFVAKLGIGCTAGGLAACIGTPTEVALIRMTSDGRLPKEQRRAYKNVFDAVIRIAREEGVTTMWRGTTPTVIRAMVVNAAQLATYSQAKELLVKTGYFHDGIILHFFASMVSGLVTTAASMPVDIAKTRIQNMKTINGRPEYRNMGDVLIKVIRREGFFSLWKGFTPYLFRLGPHTVLTFIFLEQMNKVYKKYIMHDESSGGGGL